MAAIEKPLIVIVGPTASGKTGLSIKLAKQFNGAVVSADSRAVYRHMDIGTAKPTVTEMDGVPHYMLDLVDPDQRFTLSDFQHLANKYIKEIRGSSKIPFLVGGSGLYIDSIIFDYKLGSAVDDKTRTTLEEMTMNDLEKYIEDNKIEMPENSKNKRYLIRAIEQNGVNRNRSRNAIPNAIIIGIDVDKSTIEQRIRSRIDNMLSCGFIDEVRNLVEKYGDQEAFRNNLYGVVQQLLRGEIDHDKMVERMVIVDRQLVKKQMTWFKRNPNIKWLKLDDAEKYLTDQLENVT